SRSPPIRAAGKPDGPCPSPPARARRPACWRGPRPPRRFSETRGASHLDLRQAPQRLLDLRRRIFVVLQLAGEERLVGAEVEVAVAGQVEQNRLALAALLAAQRFVDRDLDGVRRFRRGDDALGARELQRRLEGGEL